MAWVLVGTGGAIGAIVRYGFNMLVMRAVPTSFPIGIFLVNVLGSFAIGLVAGLAVSSRIQIAPDLRLFLTVGVLGGFTTFSSFSLDTLTLLRAGQPALAAANVAGQVGLSLLAVAAGYRLAS